jgi:hypothetical protein
MGFLWIFSGRAAVIQGVKPGWNQDFSTPTGCPRKFAGDIPANEPQ